MRESRTCFVICPIGSRGSPTRIRSDLVLSEIIAPAVKESGYEAVRADEIAEPGSITSRVIEHIVEDPLVVADLTDSNPNVFYELAVRHASRKPCVQMMEEGESIPFDVSDMATIDFDHRDKASRERARVELGKYIRAAEQVGPRVQTPISQAAAVELSKEYENARVILPRVLFPLITVRYCVMRFERYLERLVRRSIPLALGFRFDAQVTVTDRRGRIVSHPRPSSIGHSAEEHEGRLIWGSVEVVECKRPFRSIAACSEEEGWLAWADSGYSQQYTPISARDNHRVCLARFVKKKRRVYVLEMHQELEQELDSKLDGMMARILEGRVRGFEAQRRGRE